MVMHRCWLRFRCEICVLEKMLNMKLQNTILIFLIYWISMSSCKTRVNQRTEKLNIREEPHIFPDFADDTKPEEYVDADEKNFRQNTPVFSSDTDFDYSSIGRSIRHAGADDKEDNCIEDYHPCRKHSQCCSEYCSWKNGWSCYDRSSPFY